MIYLSLDGVQCYDKTEGATILTKVPRLQTERLFLRPFQLADAARVQQLAGHRDIATTTLNIPHPYDDGAAEAWISKHLDEFSRKRSITLAIWLREPEVLIGAIGISIDLINNFGELGYWVGVDYWNEGFCTEAGKRVIEYGFDELDLNRIFAQHLSNNPASGRVMEKLGMIFEGTLRQHVKKWGDYYDLVSYGLLKSEYELG